MDEQRKKAYRYLLYEMTLEMRGIGVVPPFRWRDLFNPRAELRRRLKRCWRLADVFHNMAHFSACDFVGFDEGRFWDSLRRLDRESGAEQGYQDVFEQVLTGERGTPINMRPRNETNE